MIPQLRNSRISTRLMAVITVLLILLAVVAGLSFRGFQSLASSANDLVDGQVRLALLANRTNQNAQIASQYLLRLLLTADRKARLPLYAAMDDALNSADQALLQFETLALQTKVDIDIVELQRLREHYGTAFQETVEQIELVGPQSAKAHFETTTEPELKALLAATDRLAVTLQDAMQAETKRLTELTATARQRIVAIGVIALLMGILLGSLIARSITIPVKQAAAIAAGIAGGDYTRELPPAGQDEIGSMLRALGAMRDRIAEREAHIRRIAYVDDLTDLSNRARITEDFLREAPSRGAFLLIDIDRFAAINKALGHAVGDDLLRGVAQRLDSVRGAHDLLARLWGDEFALLLCGAEPGDAIVAAERIRAALREPLNIDGQRIDLDASIGIALFPEHGTEFEQLLRRADGALRRAKQHHDGVAQASAADAEPSPDQLSLIGEMREALARDQFVVFYQPKLDLKTGRVSGAEALIRWRHPERGLIPPGTFIPFAEQTGFIREITPWLIRQVIRDTVNWRKQGFELVISANLSTYDLLNASLIEEIFAALVTERLLPSALCLEITESALMNEPERALRHLDRLAAYGIKLSIDDYGSGQASLAYVKDLPVHELKIDRVFVAEADHRPKNAAIVRSTILMCRELGLTVVAEGAETREEIDWLRHNGCDIVQGYGIAKPMSAENFDIWLSDRQVSNVSRRP
jgi:diguanylate cyclase (GGDEF)-like protein